MHQDTYILEAQWVKGLLENSEEAFRALYDSYERPLYRFAVYLTKSPDIAEEVVQEAFIRLWEKRMNLAPDSHILGFLKKIVQNLVINIYKKAGRDRSLLRHIHQQMEVLEHGNAGAVLEKELQRVYRAALDRLPPQQRAVFTLSRDGNLSYQEIADQLGLSRHTVRNHMVEALRSVRRYVAHNADLACLILAMILHERK
jgi:RNA polymerase sigma-70 factor (ECF subfamily)